MSKKSLLSEAQVRRFMGLAGMEPIAVSTHLTERDYGGNPGDERDHERHIQGGGKYGKGGHRLDYMKEEDDAPELEDDAMDDEADAEMDMGDAEADIEVADDVEMADAAEADVDEDTIQAAVDALASLEALVQPLADAAGIAPAGEEEMGLDMDMGPGMEELPGEEFPPEEEAAVDDTEEELVQEVARRVARRIIKARKARKMLDEALGKTNKR